MPDKRGPWRCGGRWLEWLPRTRYWTSGDGLLELALQPAQVRSVCHPGPNGAAVMALSKEPDVAEQIGKWDPEAVRAHLREYGAWCEGELRDRRQNIQRALWLACWDIVENPSG